MSAVGVVLVMAVEVTSWEFGQSHERFLPPETAWCNPTRLCAGEKIDPEAPRAQSGVVPHPHSRLIFGALGGSSGGGPGYFRHQSTGAFTGQPR